jgi:hypothetical protein
VPEQSGLRLEEVLEQIMASILRKVRYVAPSPVDTNPSRWPTHPLWNAARDHMIEAIGAQAFPPALARPGLITPLEIKEALITRQMIGLSRSWAALRGLKEDQVSEIPDLVATLLRADYHERPGHAEEGLLRARARHGVLG